MIGTRKYAASNRFARDLYARALELRFAAEDKQDVREDAKRLVQEVGSVAKSYREASASIRSRLQRLEQHAVTSDGASTFPLLQAMSKHALRNAIPGIVERANNGDQQALSAAGAVAVILGTMDASTRPMTAIKFAKLIKMPDFDSAHPNAIEGLNLVEAAQHLASLVADGRAPNANDRTALGILLQDVRPASALDAENEALLIVEEPETKEEETDAKAEETPDTAEPGDPADDDGSDSIEDPANDEVEDEPDVGQSDSEDREGSSEQTETVSEEDDQ